MNNTIYGESCYTPECLSIGVSHIGLIEFNTSNIPISCNCTLIDELTQKFSNITVDNISIPITNQPTEQPTQLPTERPTIKPTPTPVPTNSINTIHIKKNIMLMSSILLLNLIILL